jgi:hypothetical protein
VSQATAKIVADVRPEVAAALARYAAKRQISKRAVIEAAIIAYVNGGKTA